MGVLKTEGERGTGNPIVTDTRNWGYWICMKICLEHRDAVILNQLLLLLGTGFLPARIDPALVRMTDNSVMWKKINQSYGMVRMGQEGIASVSVSSTLVVFVLTIWTRKKTKQLKCSSSCVETYWYSLFLGICLQANFTSIPKSRYKMLLKW